MGPGVTRRAFVGFGTAGATALLAGCSGGGGGGGTGARRDGTPTFTPVPISGAETDPTRVPTVGSAVRLGPLVMLVERVERVDRAFVLGGWLFQQGDREFLSVDVAFRNASERYAALEVDRFEVAVSDGLVGPIEPFVETASAEYGGWAFAPGELRRVQLHYSVPEGTTAARLRGALRVRRLPDEALDDSRLVVVDLAAESADPARLGQALSAPVHGVGDAVDHEGIRVRIESFEAPVDLGNRELPAGDEAVALDLSVTNESTLPNAIVVGVGGIGGMMLADGDGRAFTNRVWFGNEIAGDRYYDDAVAIGRGETNAGVVVVPVPARTSPLYLLWTPPGRSWAVGSGVAVNRYVWRLR